MFHGRSVAVSQKEKQPFRTKQPYVKSAVDEPDISFDGDGAGGQGRVDRDLSPVVVVRVESLGYDALSQMCRILIWSSTGVGKYLLERGGERNVRLGRDGESSDGGAENVGDHDERERIDAVLETDLPGNQTHQEWET